MTLKELRELRGFTVRKLAELIDVSRQTVCHYEADICQPPDSVWQKIVKVLKLKGKDAKKSDYFRKRDPVKKYKNGDTCKHDGCNEKPTSKGYCGRHYIQSYRRRKKQQLKLLKIKG